LRAAAGAGPAGLPEQHAGEAARAADRMAVGVERKRGSANASDERRE